MDQTSMGLLDLSWYFMGTSNAKRSQSDERPVLRFLISDLLKWKVIVLFMQNDLDVCFQHKVEFLEEDYNFYIQLSRHKIQFY